MLVEDVPSTCGHRGVKPSGKSQKSLSSNLSLGTAGLAGSPLGFCLSVFDGNRNRYFWWWQGWAPAPAQRVTQEVGALGWNPSRSDSISPHCSDSEIFKIPAQEAEPEATPAGRQEGAFYSSPQAEHWGPGVRVRSKEGPGLEHHGGGLQPKAGVSRIHGVKGCRPPGYFCVPCIPRFQDSPYPVPSPFSVSWSPGTFPPHPGLPQPSDSAVM